MTSSAKENAVSADFTADGSGVSQDVTSQEAELEIQTIEGTSAALLNIHPDYSRNFPTYASADQSSHRKSSENPFLEYQK